VKSWSFASGKTLLGIASVLAFGLVGCTSSVGQTSATASVGTVSVTAVDIGFQTKEVRAPLNQPITLTLQNKGKLLHDWSVEKIPLTVVSASGSAQHGMNGHDAGMIYPQCLSQRYAALTSSINSRHREMKTSRCAANDAVVLSIRK